MTDPIAEGVKLVPELMAERDEWLDVWKRRMPEHHPIHEDWLAKIMRLQTIIAALTAAGEMAGERQGWKLVPVEPTEAMLFAAQKVCVGNIRVAETYRAMISAALAAIGRT